MEDGIERGESGEFVAPERERPGAMLTPNLRLLRLLGKGGMGSVWLAEHRLLGAEVAVKLLSPELANEPEALERFRREATAVAQLKSPHVVAIHDFGEAAGTPYFVMERLEGEDLGARIERTSRLPIGVTTAIVVQTCKALARVHELGIVHRDLKPGNIFLSNVDGDLLVKLLDFGVAKTQLGANELHHTSDSAVLGTPLYMSPEQVLSTRSVSFASDLYSLGVVAYECLAGRRPFAGETVGALHVAIASGTYTPITALDRSLAPALDAWFARALHRDPASRFASARAMADAFLAAARGEWDPAIAAGASRPPPLPLRAAAPRVRPASVPDDDASPVTSRPSHASPTSRGFVPLAAGFLVVVLLAGGTLFTQWRAANRGAAQALREGLHGRKIAAAARADAAKPVAPQSSPDGGGDDTPMTASVDSAPSLSPSPSLSPALSPSPSPSSGSSPSSSPSPVLSPSPTSAPEAAPSARPGPSPRRRKDRGF